MGHPTVADVIVDGLARAGTPRVFGGAGAPIDPAFTRALEDRGLRLFESGAPALAAAVTGELSDAPGAALLSAATLTSEPGGLAYAAIDRAPLIVLTDGPCGHEPLLKAHLAVEPVSAAHWIAHAAQLALTEPRGPVLIDVPAAVAAELALPLVTAVRPAPLPPPEANVLDVAAECLVESSHPVLIAGMHCRRSESAAWLRPFAEALPAPVLVTLKAKGVLPDPHPLVLGLVPPDGRGVLEQADLIVAVGLDAVELPGAWSTTTPVLWLGPGAAAPASRPRAGVVGAIDLILAELAPRLRGRTRADWDVAALDRLKRFDGARRRDSRSGLDAEHVVHVVREVTPAGTIAAVDGGPRAAAVTRGWSAVAPGEFLISAGRDVCGFALPAALAAALARPDRQIVAFTDESGLRAGSLELATADRLALPLMVIVFTETAGWRASLAPLERAEGIVTLSSADERALRSALEQARARGGPTVVAVTAGGVTTSTV